MSEKLIHAFREFLDSREMRLTRERETLVTEISAKNHHFDPEQLHFDLMAKGIKISRASIYRTIPLLVDAGIIQQVENTDKHAHYELTLGRSHHDHMLCTSCGKVIEFYSEKLERLQDALCEAEGFTGQAHTLEIKGLCRRCSEKTS